MSRSDYILRIFDKTDVDFLKHLDLACSMLGSDDLSICKSDYVFLVCLAACYLVDVGIITGSAYDSLFEGVRNLD